MKEIRWHARAGQGAKTAAQLLAVALLREGKSVQAFPEYGPERRGAPMRAYTRYDDRPIRRHDSIEEPDAVVVLEPSLARAPTSPTGSARRRSSSSTRSSPLAGALCVPADAIGAPSPSTWSCSARSRLRSASRRSTAWPRPPSRCSAGRPTRPSCIRGARGRLRARRGASDGRPERLARARARRRRRPRRGRAAADRRLAHRPQARRSTSSSASTACSAGSTARTRRSCSTEPPSPASTSTTARAASSAPPSARPARSRWCPMTTELAQAQLLTGGEAVAEAMRQIDPDVVPGLPDHAADADHPGLREGGRRRPRPRRADQRRVRALGDERRDRRRARRRADDDRDLVAGPRADGRGRLHRRLDARAGRDGARQPRALRPDQHPLRPLRLDADPRLRRDPALRRERAGGVRPDRDRAAARRAPGRAPARDRLPRRLHDHPLRRAGRAARRRRRCASSSASTGSRTRCSTSSASTTQGPFAMPDYYFELRRQQADAIEAPLDDLRRARRRVRSSDRPVATARSRPYRARRRRARARLPRLDAPAPRRTSSTSCATEGEARRPAEDLLLPAASRPSEIAERARRGRDAVVVLDRADSPGGAPPLFAEVAVALRPGPALRSHVYGLGGRDLHPDDIREVFAGQPRMSASDTIRRQERAVSRLKTLVRDEHGTPPLRGGHSLCQGCGIPMVVRTVLDSIERPEGRRQRDRLPRGRDDALPDDRLERPVAARRVRERGRGRERRRGRLPRAPPARRAAAGRRADDRRLRRRRRHLRHRPAGALRRARARATVRLRLLRQRGLHEHRDPALRRDPVRRGDDDQPGRRRSRSARCSSART